MATITTRFPPFVNKVESYNLLQTIRNLFQDHDYVLGVIIVLFTLVFPITKFFSEEELVGLKKAMNIEEGDPVMVPFCGEWFRP